MHEKEFEIVFSSLFARYVFQSETTYQTIDWMVVCLWFAIGCSHVSDRLIPPSCH